MTSNALTTLSHGVLVLAGVALVITASCARAPKQPDPGEGYTLETTGATVGFDVPRQRNEPDATVGEVATRLAGQICEREARCRGGGPVSQRCMRAVTRRAVLEVVTWPCSPAATRSRAKQCLAALNAEPCEMDLATKPALCVPDAACPDPQANLIPSGAILAQDWPTAGAKPLDYSRAVTGLDAIDLKPCIAMAEAPGPTAHVTVTFAPDGSVLTSKLDRGPDGSAVNLYGTAAGECIVERLRGARVPPFEGAPQNIGVTVFLE